MDFGLLFYGVLSLVSEAVNLLQVSSVLSAVVKLQESRRALL